VELRSLYQIYSKEKLIVIFAHKNFQIHSLNTLAKGEVLSYELFDTEHFNGTKISCEFATDFRYEKEEMVRKTKNFLGKCFLSDTYISINGKLFTDYTFLPITRQEDWGDLLTNKDKTTNCCVKVRFNGVFMFEKWIPDLNRNVVFEVRGNPIEVFTQNRDGFKGQMAKNFDGLMAEIAVDKSSFSRQGLRKLVIKGKTPYIQLKEFAEKLQEKLAEVYDDFILQEIQAFLAVPENQRELVKNNLSAQSLRIVDEILAEGKSSAETDFIIDLADSDHTDCPPKFHPDTMGKKYKFIAGLWKQMLIELMKIDKCSDKFQIGFTLSSEAEAIYKREDGIAQFLINPINEKHNAENKNEKYWNIFVAACHELSHFKNYQSGHGENFSKINAEVVAKALTNFPGVTEMVKRAKAGNL